MTAIERLQELLNEADEKIDRLRDERDSLRGVIDGLRDGWCRHTMIDPDPAMPVPRLEIAYEQHKEWFSYTATYRMVMVHLLGHHVAIPLGQTKVNGGSGKPPSEHLPFRDGAHAAHDSVHLGLPLFKVMPGEPPVLLGLIDYPQTAVGAQHRTHSKPAT